MAKDLDTYDRKIMHELDVDSRISAVAISRKVRLPKETVLYRIKRLESSGYIRSFYALINSSVMGYRYYKVYMKFQRLTELVEKKIIDYIKLEPNCVNLRINEGFYDMSFVTMQDSMTSFKDFLHRFNTKFGDFLLEKSVATVLSTHKFSLPLFHQKLPQRTTFDQSRPGSFKLDRLDKKIIKILSADGRQRLIAIARSLREDPKVISYRLRKLRDEGVIVGYFISWNFAKFPEQYIQVDFLLKDPEYINSIIQFFEEQNVSVFAYELLGKYDICLEIFVENDRKLRSLFSSFKEKFADKYISYDVSHIYRHFVLNWSPFDPVVRK